MKISLFIDPQAAGADMQFFGNDSGFPGATVVGVPGLSPDGHAATLFEVPAGFINGHGSRARLFADGFYTMPMQGRVLFDYPTFGWASFIPDYYQLQPLPVTPDPEPEPGPGPTDPSDILNEALEKYPNHEDALLLLREACAGLNAAGVDSGGRGPFGILRKDAGNRCPDPVTNRDYSCDVIAAGQGNAQGQWDVRTDSGVIWPGAPKTIADGIRVDVCVPVLTAP